MDAQLFPTPAGVRSDDPILALPKVSLHDHLDGGLRPQTIVELAAEAGHALPVADPEGLRAWFSESADSGDLVRYLQTFDQTLAVMQTAPALTRVAREWVLDQVADGVVVAEARWAPEQHLAGGLTLDEAVEAVQAGIEEGIALAAREGRSIRAGQIITAMRHADRATEIAQLALRHRDAGVVGFDIAGAEDGFPPENHLEAFDLLHRASFPVTIHAGEAAGAESIRSAVHVCHAQRIGHGVRITEDIAGWAEAAEVRGVMGDADGDGVETAPEYGRLAAWVLDQQVPLEVCPSSNLQTGAAESIAGHPVTRLKELGFAVTVNPDNRLMSDTSVTKEMRRLVDEAGWTLDDLEWVTVTALGCAFLPYSVRESIIDEQLVPGFARATL
ncbi:adenosine deaminase [Brevibacterium album]|uniref:adenosine deaminase n=1 Tax=Brevibacterium album TaxID=417948 RepID=UPI0004081673|nr:adenosine deaminase [Brevibacterium album]